MPVPFAGELFTFHNPDGSSITVRGWGNQFSAVFETLEGYTVMRDPDSGFYVYATLSDDRKHLEPTATRVDTADPDRMGIPKHLRIPRSESRAQAAAARDEPGVKRRWEVRRAQKRSRMRDKADPDSDEAPDPNSDEAPDPNSDEEPDPNSDEAPDPNSDEEPDPNSDEEPDPNRREEPEAMGTTGDYVGLVILVRFPDISGTITQSEVDDFCNKPGYTGFGNNGSAYDYFLDVSGGKLRYKNKVAAYYTAQHTRAHYTDPSIPFGTRTGELIVEALVSLKAHGFDFSMLSTDSAGFVYALNVFYAGQRINNWSEGLWPHSWALASPFTASASKRFSDYQITDMGTQLTLRTFCHENGHMICDFPDEYDYGGEGNGVGHYSLMCFGGSNTNPTQVDAYLKNAAGWTSTLTMLTPAMTVKIGAGRNDFLIYRKNGTEYFILENRQQSGRDATLPDAGLAIWHVDELGSNNNEQMTPSQHYEVSLEQADGRFDLERKVNGGDVEDLFGGSTAPSFGYETSPNSSWWAGMSSGLEIEQISAPGAWITVSTQGARNRSGGVTGTWAVVAMDWGGAGSFVNAGPFTFKNDGTWTYRLGGGRWIQVGNMLAWNFNNVPGLIGTATVTPNVMTGMMGYLTANPSSGSLYMLRSPSPPGNSDRAQSYEIINQAEGQMHPHGDGGDRDPAVGQPIDRNRRTT